MKLISYFPAQQNEEQCLLANLMNNIEELDMVPCHSLQEVQYHVGEDISSQKIVVLSTTDRNELSNVVMIREYLNDSIIMCVLPNEDPETIRLAHLLHPRILTNNSRFLEDIPIIIKNIFECLHQ